MPRFNRSLILASCMAFTVSLVDTAAEDIVTTTTIPTIAIEAVTEVTERVPFSANYTFYIGGLSIAEIMFNGEITAFGYDAASVVETRGVLELLVQGRVTADAKGYRHTKGHLAPEAYRTEYQTRNEAREISMTYASEVAAVMVQPPEAVKAYDTDPASHRGALDPVTAAVTLMSPLSAQDLCNRTIPVFDGKRRYDIILLPESRRPPGKSAPAPSWNKPMNRCFGVYERIAGFDGDLQGAQRYFPFDIWFENDGSKMFRAIRIAGKTKLGYAIGTLRK